jgi:hypothetical protein
VDLVGLRELAIHTNDLAGRTVLWRRPGLEWMLVQVVPAPRQGVSFRLAFLSLMEGVSLADAT